MIMQALLVLRRRASNLHKLAHRPDEASGNPFLSSHWATALARKRLYTPVYGFYITVQKISSGIDMLILERRFPATSAHQRGVPIHPSVKPFIDAVLSTCEEKQPYLSSLAHVLSNIVH